MMKKAIRFLRKLWFCYRFSALTLVNTLVALVLLNVLISAAFLVKDSLSSNPVAAKYGHSTMSTVYPDLSKTEVDALLAETWSRHYLYEPFTQFKEAPFHGRYVNVDSNGFRNTRNQGPWPLQTKSLNIFLFGGSTTFGYGVPDNQTIASYLQDYLTSTLGQDVRVYNFGQGSYYSTQERIFFEELLASGVVPDMAVFIDGLNDFFYHSDEPLFTTRLREFMAHETPVSSYSEFISNTALGRAAQGLRARLSRRVPEGQRRQFDDPNVINLVINRYLTNKKLIEAVASPFGVKCFFVWQPVPTYKYDQRYHPFSEAGLGEHMYSRSGYEYLSKLNENNPVGDNFFWCADMQQDEKTSLYVDQVHYSAAFSKQIAEVVADLLVERHAFELQEN